MRWDEEGAKEYNIKKIKAASGGGERTRWQGWTSNKYDKKHHERLMNQRKNRRSSSILRHHDGRNMKSKPEKRQNQEKEENKTLDTAGGRAKEGQGKRGKGKTVSNRLPGLWRISYTMRIHEMRRSQLNRQTGWDERDERDEALLFIYWLTC